MLPLRELLRVSRPLLWLNTAVLWLLALLALEQRPLWGDALMIAYFTFPFNLWLHGINDVYDWESDRLNTRKGSDEGALLPRALHTPMLRAVVAWNAPFWLAALWLAPPAALALLALFVALGWAYSAPPVRGKSRPGVDSAINVAYLLPFAIALAWHGAPAALWRAALPAGVAFAAWAVASHAFTSIQDLDADRAGGIHTIATALGARRTAWLALGGYLLAAGAAARYGAGWGGAVGLYALLVGWWLAAGGGRERANRLYRLFIGLNSALGFAVMVTMALARPAHTVWAALLVCALVAAVAAALAWGRYPDDAPLPEGVAP